MLLDRSTLLEIISGGSSREDMHNGFGAMEPFGHGVTSLVFPRYHKRHPPHAAYSAVIFVGDCVLRAG